MNPDRMPKTSAIKIEINIPWAVRLASLKIPIHAHFFRRAILTRKVGQTDQINPVM